MAATRGRKCIVLTTETFLGGGPDQSATLLPNLLNRAAREGSISTIGLDILIVTVTEQGYIFRVVIFGLLRALDFTRSLLCGFGNAGNRGR